MNFKKYHESRNLFDGTKIEAGRINGETGTVEYASGTSALSFADETVTISTSVAWRGFVTDFINIQEYLQRSYVSDTIMYGYEYAYDANKEFLGSVSLSEVPTDTKYVRISFQLATAVTNAKIKNIMLNTGSTALPYEPYSSEVWHDTPHYIHNTSTDTITTLPAIIYPNDTTATVGLKGNTVQSGTPTPQNPIQPNECGDLETVGEKAGQFKIPISSGQQTTNIYLGSTQTVRQIKKITFAGNEDWQVSSAWKKPNTSVFFYNQSDMENTVNNTKIYVMSDKFESTSRDGLYNGDTDMIAKTGSYAMTIRVSDSIATTTQAFKAWLASNPVTAWYVLATAQTAAVNEPLMKIGDYADTVSGITIPTIAGANSFDVLTTLKPSEVTVNYKGWHPVATVKEWDGSQWV